MNLKEYYKTILRNNLQEVTGAELDANPALNSRGEPPRSQRFVKMVLQSLGKTDGNLKTLAQSDRASTLLRRLGVNTTDNPPKGIAASQYGVFIGNTRLGSSEQIDPNVVKTVPKEQQLDAEKKYKSISRWFGARHAARLNPTNLELRRERLKRQQFIDLFNP